MARVLTKKSTVPGKVPLAADLEIGELAVNTADAKLYTKHSDNTIKQLGGDAASGYFRTEPITATSSGQTSFTVPGGYTPGAIFVSLNGASLPPADFTATNGTTVVLESGAGIVVGSVLLVYVLSAFEVANALPLGGTAADSSKLGGQAPSHYATQADLAGVTPGPEFYQRSNILGTVSQSSGVPTGAIIERGSNANGEYVRWADGTQETRRKVTISVAINIASASVYVNTFGEYLFAAEFIESPCVTYNVTHNDSNSNLIWTASWLGHSTTLAQSAGRYLVSNATRATASLTIEIVAKGRWY